MSENNPPDTATVLRQLFGDNRAEWPSVHFKDLFVSPTYLKKLESMRPCILVGGRGTGKTTSLQSLRYDSLLERIESQGFSFADQEYLGILVRMNKNRVRAFSGSDIGEAQWAKYFAHYFNLLACNELASMAGWLQTKTGKALNSEALSFVSSDLGFGNVDSLENLQSAIKRGISQLQLQVNNPNLNLGVVISIAESPLRTFAEALKDQQLLGERIIFCCIDEYENLLDYQQAVLNTYIKHAEPPISYKVALQWLIFSKVSKFFGHQLVHW